MTLANFALATELCTSESGEQGFVMIDGTCMTPSLYDERFSAEALAEVPSLADPDQSVAEVYEITPASAPASAREIGDGLVTQTFTFDEFVANLWAVAVI